MSGGKDLLQTRDFIFSTSDFSSHIWRLGPATEEIFERPKPATVYQVFSTSPHHLEGSSPTGGRNRTPDPLIKALALTASHFPSANYIWRKRPARTSTSDSSIPPLSSGGWDLLPKGYSVGPSLQQNTKIFLLLVTLRDGR